MEIKNYLPHEIEKRSFEIITEELEMMGAKLSPENDFIVKRCIHTSADFEYVDSLEFSQDIVNKTINILKQGATIITDTNMGLSGINKPACSKLNVKVNCFIADEDVAEIAKANGTTRAVASMDKACSITGNVIFAIGNAPTALIHLHKLISENKINPDLIIGVPVGFVNVIESKNLFLTNNQNTGYIINKGRKGGSNIAACICNALLYKALESLEE